MHRSSGWNWQPAAGITTRRRGPRLWRWCSLIDAMKEAHKKGDFAPEGSASPAVTEGLMMSIRKGNVAAIAEGEEGEEEEEMSQMSDYDYSGTIDVAGMGKREAQGLYNGM
eukprot:jgi/Tetstr1/435877/TSEL_024765.t1